MKVDPEQIIKALQTKKGLSRKDAIAAAVRTGQIMMDKSGGFVARVSPEEASRLASEGEKMMQGVKKREAPAPAPRTKVPMPEQKKAMGVVDVQTPEREVVTKEIGAERRDMSPAGVEKRAQAARALEGVDDVGMAKKILRKLLGGTYNPAWDLMNVDQIKEIMRQDPRPGRNRPDVQA